MKRKASGTASKGPPYTKRKTNGSKAYTNIKGTKVSAATTVAYNSRVPLSTRGYRPNTAEKKAYDTPNGAAANQLPLSWDVDNGGNARAIFIPVQGADYNQRVGRVVHLKSVYIRGTIRQLGSFSNFTDGAHSGTYLRLILLTDLQPNGSLPNINDVLVTADPRAQLNLNYRDRFVIHWDKYYTFPAVRALASAGTQQSIGGQSIYTVKKYKKIPVDYQSVVFGGTTGAIADVTTGNLILLGICDAGTGLSNSIRSQLSIRCRYIDN